MLQKAKNARSTPKLPAKKAVGDKDRSGEDKGAQERFPGSYAVYQRSCAGSTQHNEEVACEHHEGDAKGVRPQRIGRSAKDTHEVAALDAHAGEESGEKELKVGF